MKTEDRGEGGRKGRRGRDRFKDVLRRDVRPREIARVEDLNRIVADCRGQYSFSSWVDVGSKRRGPTRGRGKGKKVESRFLRRAHLQLPPSASFHIYVDTYHTLSFQEERWHLLPSPCDYRLEAVGFRLDHSRARGGFDRWDDQLLYRYVSSPSPLCVSSSYWGVEVVLPRHESPWIFWSR